MKIAGVGTILAAVAVLNATAQPAQHQTGSYPLITGGGIACLVASEYDATADKYALSLGKCESSNVVNFDVVLENRISILKSSTHPGYCLSTLQVNNKINSPVGLAPCCKSKKGQKWTHLKDTDQLKNGYELCLEANNDKVYQTTCRKQPMQLGSTQVYAFLYPFDPSTAIALDPVPLPVTAPIVPALPPPGSQ